MSQYHGSPEKIAWWDDPQAEHLSPDERAAIAEEASKWFVVRDETDRRKRARLLTWALRSRHHLTAYVATAEIEAEINNANKNVPAVALEPATPWDKVGKHPLATIAAVIVATAGIVWTVSYNLRVEPATQHIKILEEQVQILKLQLAAAEKPRKPTSSAARHAATSHKKAAEPPSFIRDAE